MAIPTKPGSRRRIRRAVAHSLLSNRAAKARIRSSDGNRSPAGIVKKFRTEMSVNQLSGRIAVPSSTDSTSPVSLIKYNHFF